MRAVFTQMSILIALSTGSTAYAADPSLMMAILYGMTAGCTAYFILFVGDFSIHRILEGRSPELTSVTFIEDSFEPVIQNESDVSSPIVTPGPEPIAA